MSENIDYKRLAERAMIIRLITEVYPSGPVSLVSDTFDFWGVMTDDIRILKPVIMARDGKVVFRPDSGDPADIVCGTAHGYSQYETLEKALSEVLRFNSNVNEDAGEEYLELFEYKGRYFAMEQLEDEVVYKPTKNIEEDEMLEDNEWIEIEPTPEMKGAVQCLWDVFQGTFNVLGYRTLDQHVGMIYGDSINLKRAQDILQRLKNKGFASDNIVFGIGSYTYQGVTRDTFGTALKATFGRVKGEYRELFKDPKTDNGTKKSARGLVRVEFENGNFVMYDQQTLEQEKEGALRPVFCDGTMLVDEFYETIRSRLQLQSR